MHFAVERNILDHFAAIGFEGGAEVVDGNAGEPRHDPVGAGGGNAAQDEVVNAHLAPAGDDVVSLVELFKKSGNVVGIVLQVAVHGQDELARGVVKAGGQGRGLAKVAAQLDDQHAAVDGGNFFKELVGPVVRAVINQDQLKGVVHLLHDLLEPGIEDCYVFFFIVKWHNNRVFRHVCSFRRQFDVRRMSDAVS